MFFTKEKGHQYKLQSSLRRICDRTSPNLPRQIEFRGHNRQNRSVPILLAPWENGEPVVSEATTALTKDISDQGLSVVLSQPFQCDEVIVGLLLPRDSDTTSWFFRGKVRSNVQIGGGFWALGIEVVERLTSHSGSSLEELLPLTARLVPPRTFPSPPATVESSF